ncbi:MAG: AbrB/MazE/SpoVT family DNA-binding domain-containing protein [Leptolyngbya foveolarum]|uniref:AbrB/MazE/SpoVT family DNA-binding domain-containing protein n=1 Tax=Leptolyngbya foveolarum TaxID=47253 RepID=A0A2W4VK00_9CYAN|nr:MAG: AbrB/MazE/SpoVT family DNA-binding domain-containing protein [Leptolyngbya foveolarum]
MDVRVKKWGNSIGLRIPYKLAEKLNIGEDSIVELTASLDTITIKKKQNKFTLDEILASIPEDFRYPEDVADFVESGPVGQEMI